MATPPGRKRPHCHTCGAPMSGHKRINSKPVCPDGKSASPGPRRSPRLVPHVVIPPYAHPLRAKKERPPSPTSTVLNEEITKGEEMDEPEEVGMPSTPLQPTSSFSALMRTIGLDRPVTSLFVSPKSRISAVHRHAGDMGMFSGTVYKPRTIKEEESERWVVMGRDAAAVDRLLDSQEKEAERQLRLGRRMPGGSADGGSEVMVKSIPGGVGFFQLVLASGIGGFVVWYCLCHL